MEAHWVSVDERVFSEEVVMKSLYWLSGRYNVEVKREPGRADLVVGFRGTDRAMSAAECGELEARFRRDLIDFKTRAIVEAETRNVRDLLVAKAFDQGGSD